MIVPLAIRRLDHAPYQPGRATTVRKHLAASTRTCGQHASLAASVETLAPILVYLVVGGGRVVVVGSVVEETEGVGRGVGRSSSPSWIRLQASTRPPPIVTTRPVMIVAIVPPNASFRSAVA